LTGPVWETVRWTEGPSISSAPVFFGRGFSIIKVRVRCYFNDRSLLSVDGEVIISTGPMKMSRSV
jgi:hypothetical protein